MHIHSYHIPPISTENKDIYTQKWIIKYPQNGGVFWGYFTWILYSSITPNIDVYIGYLGGQHRKYIGVFLQDDNIDILYTNTKVLH